jgi:hypothetical protein
MALRTLGVKSIVSRSASSIDSGDKERSASRTKEIWLIFGLAAHRRTHSTFGNEFEEKKLPAPPILITYSLWNKSYKSLLTPRSVQA